MSIYDVFYILKYYLGTGSQFFNWAKVLTKQRYNVFTDLEKIMAVYRAPTKVLLVRRFIASLSKLNILLCFC